jgi:ATP-dependent helicase HepA
VVVVKYFAGPGHEWVETHSIADLQSAQIVSQQRAWVVLDPGGPNELAQFIRLVTEVSARRPPVRAFAVRLLKKGVTTLDEDEFHVHSGARPADPFDNLAARGVETPFFFDMRDRLVRAVVGQRVVSRGLTCLISARIDLYRHQVEVVRRVLQDPRQRYLLADEVGLGKTIQAGCVIRQLLLDDPNATVLILAPPHLTGQWRQELRLRFGVKASADPAGAVCVAAFAAAHQAHPPELLVIDEAHHLFTSPDDNLLTRLDELAVGARRLLLLTATPVLGYEREWLRLLSWLDPDVYQNTQAHLAGLRARIEGRREVGRELIALATAGRDVDAYPLRGSADRLGEMFGAPPYEDTRAVGLCRQLAELLDTDELDEGAVRRAAADLRLYIGESYRLHRRVIRNRRRYLSEAWTRREATTVADMFPDTRLRVWQAFEAWRSHIAYASADDPAAVAQLVPVFQALAEAVGSWSALAARTAETRLYGSADVMTDLALFAAVARPLAIPGRFAPGELVEGEWEHLRQLVAALRDERMDEDRPQTLVTQLRLDAQRGRLPDKTVVFTSFTATALELIRRLEAVPALTGRVLCLTVGMQPEEAQAAVGAFANDTRARVLVADRTGQEGWNLQFANRLVHFDLPLDPFALEQRAGRLDRITRRWERMPILVVHSEVDGPAVDDAWYRLVGEGLGAFREPISDLYLFLESRLPELLREALTRGPTAWDEAVAGVRAAVTEERQLNAEQDVLDAADLSPEDAERFFAPLERYESPPEEDEGGRDLAYEFRDAVLGYLRANNIDDYRYRTRPEERKNFHARHNVLLREDWFKQLAPLLCRRGVWTREQALMDPGADFFRLGHSFIDLIEQLSREDDRGQSFLAWRQVPGRDGESVFVRVNVVVEANLALLREALAGLGLPAGRERELLRLADFFFPPRYESLFLTADGHPVAADDRAAIEGPYDPNTQNLASPGYVHLLNEVIGAAGWQSLVDAARCEVPARVAGDAGHAAAVARGLEELDVYFTRRTRQLDLRRRGGAAEVEDELDAERRLWGAMRAAVERPAVRVDAVGVLIVSGERAQTGGAAAGAGVASAPVNV